MFIKYYVCVHHSLRWEVHEDIRYPNIIDFYFILLQ